VERRLGAGGFIVLLDGEKRTGVTCAAYQRRGRWDFAD
jgi:hypothetical protein